MSQSNERNLDINKVRNLYGNIISFKLCNEDVSLYGKWIRQGCVSVWYAQEFTRIRDERRHHLKNLNLFSV